MRQQIEAAFGGSVAGAVIVTLLVIAGLIGIGAIYSFVLMVIFNATVHAIFDGPQIGFIDATALAFGLWLVSAPFRTSTVRVRGS